MDKALAEMGIRSYGPGKFDTILDCHIYQASLDGCDEETGSAVDMGVWYGLLRGRVKVSEKLTEEEAKLLNTSVGIILSENSDGFVTVEYYSDREELDAAWAECLAETEETEETEE